MVLENATGAYLGPGPDLSARARQVIDNPNFDVFDAPDRRVLLGKCSRLPDDEEPTAGRYGIDFHRALPLFQEDAGITCDWGDGPIPVNAFTYAQYLPKTLKFREFTANLAFAARTRAEYEAKSRIYQEFYHHLYQNHCATVIAAPHAGEVRRPPDSYHPYPQSETDAWTHRVAIRYLDMAPAAGPRLLISLHSTDYFGTLLDLGDFGLPQNGILSSAISRLNRRFSPDLLALLPAYREYLLPYTLARLQYMEKRWGTLEPEPLKTISTAVRFEVLSLMRVLEKWLPLARSVTRAWLTQGLEAFFESPPQDLITLNHIFSGRKTAKLLHLKENLARAGFETAVQVETSRFLGQYHPELAAAVLSALERDLRENL